MNKHNDYKKGLWAERIARIFLMLKGYRILKNRYKTPVGEVDIVPSEKEMKIMEFCLEPKSRREILEDLLGIHYRQKNFDNNVGRLVSFGYIESTEKESQTSPTQKYITTPEGKSSIK